MDAVLKINKRTSKLIAPPINKGVLDLRNFEIEANLVYYPSIEYYDRVKWRGRLPRPNLAITNNETIHKLIVPSNRHELEYVTVENLPNLTTLIIQPDRRNSSFIKPPQLRWFIGRNLPSLKKIVVNSGLYWLEIGNAPTLQTLDVHQSPDLDFFSIRECQNLTDLNITGCRKLRRVEMLSEQALQNLHVPEQIAATQKQSRLNGRLYEHMTWTDIDLILSKIEVFMGEVVNRDWYEPHYEGVSYKLGRPFEFMSGGETPPYSLNEDRNGRGSIEGCLSAFLGQLADELAKHYTSLRLENLSGLNHRESLKRIIQQRNRLLRIINKKVPNSSLR